VAEGRIVKMKPRETLSMTVNRHSDIFHYMVIGNDEKCYRIASGIGV